MIFENTPVFALIKRDRVKIGLQRESAKRPAGTGNCYIWVDDVRRIYEELSEKGLDFEDNIAFRDEYELTDFVIYDLDQNHIGIGGP